MNGVSVFRGDSNEFKLLAYINWMRQPIPTTFFEQSDSRRLSRNIRPPTEQPLLVIEKKAKVILKEQKQQDSRNTTKATAPKRFPVFIPDPNASDGVPASPFESGLTAKLSMGIIDKKPPLPLPVRLSSSSTLDLSTPSKLSIYSSYNTQTAPSPTSTFGPTTPGIFRERRLCASTGGERSSDSLFSTNSAPGGKRSRRGSLRARSISFSSSHVEDIRKLASEKSIQLNRSSLADSFKRVSALLSNCNGL